MYIYTHIHTHTNICTRVELRTETPWFESLTRQSRKLPNMFPAVQGTSANKAESTDGSWLLGGEFQPN